MSLRVLEVGKSTAGTGAYLQLLARGLDRKKFQLTFVCLSEGGAALAAELTKVPDVQAVSMQMNRFKVDVLGDLLVAFRLARLIRAKKFDLVHAHAAKAGFLARVAAVGSGTPVIYSPHCFPFHEGTGRLKAIFYALIERFAARFLTARIVTVSHSEQILARRYRVGSQKQFVNISTGMDTEAYQLQVDRDTVKASLCISAGKPLVGAVGRLAEQKDPLTFVQMAAFIHKQMPDVNFIWVGTGPLLSDAQKLACQLGLQDVIHFVGERKDVHIILNIMDCFVLPSRWEGLSIVLLEAMAAGLPIVATAIPNNVELIKDGTSGWLVPVGDASMLAQRVMDLLQSPARAFAFSQISKNYVRKNFTFPHMIAAIDELYTEVYEESEMSREKNSL